MDTSIALNVSKSQLNTMFFFSVCQGWDELEKAEHEREVALRDELIRSAIIIIVIGKGLSVIASIIHHILHLILVLLK